MVLRGLERENVAEPVWTGQDRTDRTGQDGTDRPRYRKLLAGALKKLERSRCHG